MGRVLFIQGEYYIEFVARGLPYRRKAGGDLEEARRLLQRIEEQIKRAETALDDEVVTLHDFIARTESYWALTLHPVGLARCRAVLARWMSLFSPDITLHEITPRVFGRVWKKGLAVDASPLWTGLSWLVWSDLFEEARRCRMINDHPMKHLEPAGVPSVLTSPCQEIVEPVLQKVWSYEAPLRDILSLMAYQGLGYEEARFVRTKGLRPGWETLLEAPGTKLRLPRRLPWHPALIMRRPDVEGPQGSVRDQHGQSFRPLLHRPDRTDAAPLGHDPFPFDEAVYRRPDSVRHQVLWSHVFARCCHTRGMRFLQWHRYLGFKDVARSAAVLLLTGRNPVSRTDPDEAFEPRLD